MDANPIERRVDGIEQVIVLTMDDSAPDLKYRRRPTDDPRISEGSKGWG
jgi:hypothetical protein